MENENIMQTETEAPAPTPHTCASCGKELGEGLAFCPYCGVKAEPEAVPLPPVCKTCGKELGEGLAFCPYCGAKTTVDEAIPTPEEQGDKKRRRIGIIVVAGAILLAALIAIIMNCLPACNTGSDVPSGPEEVELTATEKLAKYARANGEWDADGQYYFVSLGSESDDNLYYSRALFYYPDTGLFSISLLFDSDYQYYFVIRFTEPDEPYDWEIAMITSDYYMSGNFYPSTFSRTTDSLSYTATDLPYSLRTSTSELAATLATLLLTHLTGDLSGSGVSAKDLGFSNFNY
ncbi:MAG: zinc ribbon domain-containing protein [Clostridia bacterium]|nr:zinc ribbon domain-containing protein [Clostridia bacterium]